MIVLSNRVTGILFLLTSDQRRICGFGNIAVTNDSDFWSTIVGLSLCSWAMSADIFYAAGAVDALRFLFQSALGIWR
jgi:hypothetical protein